MSKVQPLEVRELARTRARYEGGRFLMDAVMRLQGEARDRIVAWAIETDQPGIFESQGTNKLICSLVLAEAARQEVKS